MTRCFDRTSRHSLAFPQRPHALAFFLLSFLLFACFVSQGEHHVVSLAQRSLRSSVDRLSSSVLTALAQAPDGFFFFDYVEGFIADIEKDADVKAVWDEFSKFFGKTEEEKAAASKARKDFFNTNPEKHRLFSNRLNLRFLIDADIETMSSDTTKANDLDKMFVMFYKLYTGEEIEINGNAVLRIPVEGDDDVQEGILNRDTRIVLEPIEGVSNFYEKMGFS